MPKMKAHHWTQSAILKQNDNNDITDINSDIALISQPIHNPAHNCSLNFEIITITTPTEPAVNSLLKPSTELHSSEPATLNPKEDRS